ncbi:Outer membrane protein OmpA [Microlunatus sagamiharensis]|uniref:Outer membrane protein OmpA n=1 Tax=Microlunatus sagamiharensis TaxID=546874 RepID=A0A1H2MIL4_9ACTN|nr:fibronectin type III domain-containing protein [Microlunatus sagamiharensis]SDU92924.1 Outer membrane protein OmpA [Microlunatus sagamiharensis]
MPLDESRLTAADPFLPRSPGRPRTAATPRVAALGAATLVLASVFGTVAAVPASASVTCADGTTPEQNTTLLCETAGSATVTVPAGTSSVDVSVVGAGGGAGYPARGHIGGNAATVEGTLTLPAGTAYLQVVVGGGGSGDNHGTSTGGGASAVFAQDSEHGLLAKLAIAGGGGGGAYNGDGGDAGSAGTSDDAQTVSGPGQPGVGGTGGAGGTGNYAAGTAGHSDDPAAPTVSDGGTGGQVPGGATGGGGGEGYAGGGGGGGSRGGILSSNVAGGGGGSSLASSYLGDASIEVAQGTGGVQLPGLVASDGAEGQVSLTFHGPAVPAAPTGVTVTPGDRTATLSFTVPDSDGGQPITGYEVSVDGGDSWDGVATTAAQGSSTERTALLGGLLNGRTYEIAVRARNADGAGAATPASSTSLQPWFSDPVSVTDRAAEVPVPAKPTSYKGKVARTVATNRAHDGTVAMNAPTLKGRQLQSGQAVQLSDKIFKDSTSKLTTSGKKVIKSIAPSLTYVDAISCEGYTNYGSPSKQKGLTKLAKARAAAVCSTLASYAEQVDVDAKVGYGGDRPVIIGSTYAKRADNRRVVVVIDPKP